MKLNPQVKLLYLITSGQTTPQSTPESKDFSNILRQIEAAVAARIDLIQIREKQLAARGLFELTTAAVEIAQGSSTRILVNHLAGIAVAACAHGVHLAANSLDPQVARSNFGDNFVIGVSTHSLAEARSAQSRGADFVVLGPIFETSSKLKYGPPLGLEALKTVCTRLAPFPVLALGGINPRNVSECARAGASGVAGIGMFQEVERLEQTAEQVRISLNE